jgi:hypothetical protein
MTRYRVDQAAVSTERRAVMGVASGLGMSESSDRKLSWFRTATGG